MTLSPRTVRLDLKCGKGAISKGEKCSKGPAREAIEKAAPVALGLGLAAGLIALRRRGKKPRIGDGGTVPNIPKNPPKPPPNSSNPARTAEMAARAKAATQRGIGRSHRRVRENPQEVAWEMQADRIKKSAIRDVTRSKKFNDAFNINIPDSAARKITDRTNPSRITSAGEMVYSWLKNTGISTKEAETLVRKKGKILDIYGIPDLDVDTASNDLVKGSNSVNSEAVQKVRAAIEKFYRSDSTDSYIQYYAPAQLQPPTRRDACWEGYEQVGMKRKGKRKVPNCVPTAQNQAQNDTEDGKKYSKTVTNPETGRKNKVRYGAKGYKIAPGTSKGDNYCARSFGDMKSHGKDCSGPDRNTPLCLSRAKWKCSGKTSRRDGLTPGKLPAW